MHAPARPRPRHRRRRAWTAPLLALVLAVPTLAAVAAPEASAASGTVTISSSVSRSTITRGTKVTVRGDYRQGGTAVTCCSLRLQQRTTGSWRTVATLKPAQGKVSRTVTPKVTTSYRFITTSGKTVSPVRTVKVRAATAASAKVTLSSSVSASKVKPGTKVTVTGYYRQGTKPISRYSVRLQQRTTGSWTTVRTVRPSSKGKLTTKVSPTRTTQYRWTTTSGKTVSPTRKVTVSKVASGVTVSSKASASRITAGTSVTLTSRYRSNGAPVTCCYLRVQASTTGSWKTLRTLPPSSTGNYTYRVTPTATTSYRFITTSGKTVSPVRKVTVTPRTNVPEQKPEAPKPEPKPDPETSAPPSATAPDAFTIAGKGFGHGLGMSQFGAYGMATAGRTSTQILEHYFTGTSVANRTLPEDVAVQVIAKSDPDTLTFTIDSGMWRIRTAKGTTARDKIPSGTTGTLKIVGGKPVVVVGGTTYPKASERGATLRLHWSGTEYYQSTGTPAVARLLRESGSAATHGTYRHGRFTVTVIDGHLNVVNELRFADEYLYGLGEMPSSWPQAALEAQAIAGRSYAFGKVAAPRRAACNCNVVDSTSDQFFTGWTKENEGTNGYYGKRWQAAVDAVTSGTKGRVVLHDGGVATTYYSSSTGGRTANSEEVWFEKIPYIRSVDDPWSQQAPGDLRKTNRVWTSTLTQAQAASIFGLTDIARIEVTETWASGQAKTLRATSVDGRTVDRSEQGDRFRTLLGLPGGWIDKVTPGQ
ncbi:SpoIID/LytB domain-containing protein [Flavimobilis sp. GY10621]|uniref:SpoIID/LytB domain-containing protein n=1 Tax=Flavimobilis rhizosphaerae TaxID=2775421 RepID=A0ABR9DPP4_9MICO|nr:SpoIID/LytB domain-containing protein [Flavimobilis rhizosphaerae]MBD9698953.1 SpoIID/LytB domain-containing protein [Flavimobilis rhizosphaerae]